jgi:hypothetical protein
VPALDAVAAALVMLAGGAARPVILGLSTAAAIAVLLRTLT